MFGTYHLKAECLEIQVSAMSIKMSNREGERHNIASSPTLSEVSNLHGLCETLHQPKESDTCDCPKEIHKEVCFFSIFSSGKMTDSQTDLFPLKI